MCYMTISAEEFNFNSKPVCSDQSQALRYQGASDDLTLDLIHRVVNYWRHTIKGLPEENLETFFRVMEEDLRKAFMVSKVSCQNPLRFFLSKNDGIYTGHLIAYAHEAGLSELSIPEAFVYEPGKETCDEIYIIPGAAVVLEKRQEKNPHGYYPIIKEIIFDTEESLAGMIVLMEFLALNLPDELLEEDGGAIVDEFRATFFPTACRHFQTGSTDAELLLFSENLPRQSWFREALSRFMLQRAAEGPVWPSKAIIVVSSAGVYAQINTSETLSMVRLSPPPQ